MFEKGVGEFTVTVSDPFPYWIKIEHEFCDGTVTFEHEQLDDIIYALTQARQHIIESRAAAQALRTASEQRAQDDGAAKT